MAKRSCCLYLCLFVNGLRPPFLPYSCQFDQWSGVRVRATVLVGAWCAHILLRTSWSRATHATRRGAFVTCLLPGLLMITYKL